MAEQLYSLALDYAELQGIERVYDLYSGIGTVALMLAPRVAEVWGLELVEEAVADAIANASLNEVTNARFFAGDVRLALRELVAQAGSPDLVVVDPPRAGLSQKVVRRIIEARAQPDRVRVLQPHHAGAQCCPARGRRLPAGAGAAGGHVPAHAAHRVRGAARA